MAATGVVTMVIGEDWEISISCKGVAGGALDLTGGSAKMRIASHTALILEKVGAISDPPSGIAVFPLTPAEQSLFVGGRQYQLEVQAVLSDGSKSTQFIGALDVHGSLFVTYP